MKSSIAIWLYPLAGIIFGAIEFACEGQRGSIGTMTAWLICAVPIIINRVAANHSIRKKSLNRGMIVAPPGMFLRFAWTLGGSALVWAKAKEHVGSGFWPAVLIFYLIALMIQARDAIDRLK